MIFIMFMQVFSFLFENDIFAWSDDILLEVSQSILEYLRIVEAIENSHSQVYYLIFFYFAVVYITVISLLLAYLRYTLENTKYYFETVTQLLRILLLLSYFVFFMPFYEIFTSVFRCDSESEKHFHLTEMTCYSDAEHIIMVVLSVIALIALILFNIVIALLYNET